MADGYFTESRKRIPLPANGAPSAKNKQRGSRARRPASLSFSYRYGGVTPTTGQGIYDYRSYQSTTSFRTGRSEPEFLTAQELLNFYLIEENRKRSSIDTGHTFKSVERYEAFSHENVTLLGDGGHFYQGSLLPTSSGSWAFNANEAPPAMEVNTYGNRAISKIAPTAPKANLSVSLAELAREGFPKPGEGVQNFVNGASFYRSLGKEYLSAEFGWLPFIRDLIKVYQSMKKVTETITQFERDSGLLVRRRLEFPPSATTTSSVVNTTTQVVGNIGIGENRQYLNLPVVMPTIFAGNLATNGRGTRTQTTVNREVYWFSGAFTYHLSAGKTLTDKVARYEQLINQVLGTRMTPDVLWALAPWSWFVDWFVDVSAALATASAFQQDGLAMPYGYLMRTSVLSRTTTLGGLRFKSDPNLSLISATGYLVTKERAKGTPFGFGLNPNDFSVRQWAILAALGVTRAPKGL